MSRRRTWLVAVALLAPLLIGLRLATLDFGWLRDWAPQDSVLIESPQETVTVTPEPVEAPLPPPVTGARGVPFRLQVVRRDALPEPPFGPLYAALIGPAEAGDVDAQYRLGEVLYQCRAVPEARTDLETQVENILQTRTHGQWDVDDPVAEVAELRRVQAACAGVPESARQDYRGWIGKAADAGSLQAMLRMPYVLPQAEYCQYLWQCSDAQREFQAGLQAEALHYTELAREAGSADALWSFGGWYMSDEVLPTNDIQAYAHFLALADVYAAAGQPDRFERMLVNLRTRLRPVDAAEAERLADQLLANPRCCTLVQ